MKRPKGDFGHLAHAAIEYADARNEWLKTAHRKTAKARAKDPARSKRMKRAVRKLRTVAKDTCK